MKIAMQILEEAKQKSITFATAESCTGGMIAAALTETPGSSAAFVSGFVTYANAAKVQMLGVTQATLDRFGAVSEPIAAEMAQGAVARSDARIAVSTTGIAGPGGSEHKPEGRVCFGVATSRGTQTETVEFGPLGRAKVRLAARDHALKLLLTAIRAQ